MTLSCITIDDEPPAVDLLNHFVAQTPFLKLAGSFNSAIEGLQFININKVDLIFLDIQMPDLSGIELARILAARNGTPSPAIIFTTAFDEFALEGYKLDVIDYLLKPINYEDFLRGANKVMSRLQRPPQAEEEPKIDDFIFLKVEFQTLKINCSNITFVEGLKDYAKINVDNAEKSILSLITLKALEEKLPQGRFMRIHKSFIIALDKITSVTKNTAYIGTKMFPVSDQYKEEFALFIQKWR